MDWTHERSALVVPVPDAEPVVGRHRSRHDPSCVWGVPPHVTVHGPFVEPEGIDDDVRTALRALFAATEPFAVRFARTARFPTVLYLAPEPADPFRSLTQALVERFPGYPPYEGEFDDPVPHLTVAYEAPEGVMDEIDREIAPGLPIETEATEVLLIVGRNAPGGWRTIEAFPLGRRA